jgi:hypothetical protein
VIVMVTRARVPGRFGSRATAGLLLLTSAVAAALLAGNMIGLLGAAIDPMTRAMSAALAAAALLWSAATRRHPWQLNRETNQRWLTYGDWRTAALNGLALGLGFTTRIGFWLFYVVLLSAFVVADPLYAALGYAAYAASRVGGSLMLWITGLRVAGRGWLPRLRTMTDVITFAALGYLMASATGFVLGHLR